MRAASLRAAACAALPALAAAACGPRATPSGASAATPDSATDGAAPAARHAIFRLDGHEYVYEDEVDAWLELMESLEPGATLPQLQRLAITNIVLPRAMSRRVDPAAHADALQRARALHARLLEGGEPGADLPATETIAGTWKEIGLDVWALCRQAEIGEWQEPLESVGAFYLYRLLEPPRGDSGIWRPNSEITVELLRLPFIPEESPKQILLQAEEQVRLEVLDPAWEELVPLVLRNRMQAVVRKPEDQQR